MTLPNNGIYIAFTNQGGSSPDYGIVLICLTDYPTGSGCVKIGGGEGFKSYLAFGVNPESKVLTAATNAVSGFYTSVYEMT